MRVALARCAPLRPLPPRQPPRTFARRRQRSPLRARHRRMHLSHLAPSRNRTDLPDRDCDPRRRRARRDPLSRTDVAGCDAPDCSLHIFMRGAAQAATAVAMVAIVAAVSISHANPSRRITQHTASAIFPTASRSRSRDASTAPRNNTRTASTYSSTSNVPARPDLNLKPQAVRFA
jgi:hypothetical protein